MTKLIGTKDEKILTRAKDAFHKMQNSWWEFAKIIYEISAADSYKLAGYETFKEYCEGEFPSANYKTLAKFVSIVETFGSSIELKMEKDKAYTFPAYEACYKLASMKDGLINDDEMAVLKNDVLEKKLSYHKLRDRIADLAESNKKEIKVITNKSDVEISKLDKQLEQEIDNEDFDSDDDDSGYEVYEPVIMPDDLVESDYETPLDECFLKALKSSSDLYDVLELVEERLSTKTINKKIEKFAYKMDETYQKLEALINQINKMS